MASHEGIVDKHIIARLAEVCEIRLNLCDPTLPDEYHYSSLPLCVIDAVFSIGVRYRSAVNVVNRYAEWAKIRQYRNSLSDIDASANSHKISDLLKCYRKLGCAGMATIVFQNGQRTSSKSGILKSCAVQKFAEVLVRHDVETLKDAWLVLGNAKKLEKLEVDITKVPGQRSGITFKYFCMLAGSSDLIKPDRMIRRFLFEALGSALTPDECQESLQGVVRLLLPDYPHLTPRMLDYRIWAYQRTKGSALGLSGGNIKCDVR